MPEPAWADTDYDPWEKPDIGSEIMGRGLNQRKSKTFLQNTEHATLLAFIRGHIRMLYETFRRLHAAHHTTTIEVESHGETTLQTVPHVLSDEEVRTKYPIVVEWERLHQEHVDHCISVAGFSVRAASGYHDESAKESRQRGQESSAGTDRGQGNERWR